MNIIQLKNALFRDIEDPMDFLRHRNMKKSDTLVNEARVKGSTAYFYTGQTEWRAETPVSRVVDSNVNEFKGDEHRLILDARPEGLEALARMAFEKLTASKDYFKTFDAFWKACRRPSVYTFEMPCWSRRGRHRRYVNIYHQKKEFTGRCAIPRGSQVRCSVYWTLTESVFDQHVQVGFRPYLANGIEVVRLGGPPPIVKAPWSWLDIDFQRLAVEMFDHVWVKAPIMTVTSLQAAGFVVTPTSDFEQAIGDFHALANAPEWTGHVVNTTKTMPIIGSRVMMTLVPSRSSSTIRWSTVKLRVLPAAAEAMAEAVAAGLKRRHDNTDTSSSAKTKRPHTLYGSGDHKAK